MIERRQAPRDPEFSTAKNALYDLLDSTEFVDALAAKQIGHDEEDKPPYWRAMSAHDRKRIPDDMWDHFRATMSHFNGQVRRVAEVHPGVSVQQLHGHLSSMIGLAVENQSVSEAAPDFLRDIIRGAQHEIAFGQIATAAGMEVFPATVSQDLQARDWLVRDQSGQQFEVDVKASLNTLFHSGAGHNPYLIHPDGKIMMHSSVEDKDFGDRFFISDTLAAAKAGYIKSLFEEIKSTLYWKHRKAR